MPTPQQQQWHPDSSWDRSPITMVPTSKWCENERSREQVYREMKDSRDWKDRDRDSRERERDKRREKKEKKKSNKMKETTTVEEEQKKLDLDTR